MSLYEQYKALCVAHGIFAKGENEFQHTGGHSMLQHVVSILEMIPQKDTPPIAPESGSHDRDR